MTVLRYNPLRFADPSGMFNGDSILVDVVPVHINEFYKNSFGTVRDKKLEEVTITNQKKKKSSGWFHGFMDVLGTIDPTGIVDIVHTAGSIDNTYITSATSFVPTQILIENSRWTCPNFAGNWNPGNPVNPA